MADRIPYRILPARGVWDTPYAARLARCRNLSNNNSNLSRIRTSPNAKYKVSRGSAVSVSLARLPCLRVLHSCSCSQGSMVGSTCRVPRWFRYPCYPRNAIFVFFVFGLTLPSALSLFFVSSLLFSLLYFCPCFCWVVFVFFFVAAMFGRCSFLFIVFG